MPQPDTTGAELIAGDNTANHEGQDVATATQNTPTEQATEQTQTEQPSRVSQGILDRLGVPKELASQIGLAESEAESPPPADPETETPDGSSETVNDGSEETEPEPTTTGEGEQQHTADDLKPNKTWPPEVQAEFNKRIGKLTKQKSDERTLRETVEAERDELKQQLEAAQPVTVMPSAQDPLAWVETPAQLASLEQEADMTLEWCDRNKDGATVTQKDGTETEITPEQVDQMRTNANRALRQVPRRKEWIAQRSEADAIARAGYPRIFEKNTPEYQFAQAILKEVPSIASHPARNLMLGDYLVGFMLRMAADEKVRKAATAGNGSNSNGTRVVKTADSPNPLTRKIPPVAQHVPRTSGAPVRTGKQVDDAMNNVMASGGDNASIAAAFRAFKNAEKTAPNKRASTPATV